MALKLAELTEAVKRLRLRKAPLRFRPRLIYLVETGTGYVHPKRQGYMSGQTAWSDPSLWFQCHKDAADHADTIPAWEKPRVVKLNLCAFEEPVIRSSPTPP